MQFERGALEPPDARPHEFIRLNKTDMKELSKATTSFWAFDAFDCLVGGAYSHLTAEAVSRVNAFLEAYTLFDKVVVSEGYFSQNKRLFDSIDPDRKIIEVIPSENLRHTQTLVSGQITFDASLFERTVVELREESQFWFLEHQSALSEEDISGDNFWAGIVDSFFLLQLWQWGACKEMSELSEATVLLPNSLKNIEAFDAYRLTTDFVVRNLDQLKQFLGEDLKEIEFYQGQPLVQELSTMPPVFAWYVDMHVGKDSSFDTLAKLRDEMTKLRETRRDFERNLRQAKSFAERKNLISDFNQDWKRVCDSGFQKPKLFTSEVSGGDVAKATIDAVDAKLSAGTSVISKLIEFRQARKAHNRFKSYTQLFDRAGNVLSGDGFLKGLEKKFRIESYIPRTLKK